MSHGDQIMIDVGIERADMTLHANARAARQRLRVHHAERLLVRLLAGDAVVRGEPILGGAVAAFAADAISSAEIRPRLVVFRVNVALEAKRRLVRWHLVAPE